MPKSLAISDYLSTFYAPAHLVATGRADLLYPPPKAMTFDGTSYDEAAHKLIKDLPKTATAAYQYPPLLALFLAPLSWLPQNWSLFVFQLISLACLALATENILSVLLKDDMTAGDVLLSVFVAITFMPILLTLWIGQIGIIVGVLPLSFGYRLLLKKKPVQAGLIMSLCMLKPQFLVPALFLAAAPVVQKKIKCLIALGCGALLFLLANLVIFGPQVLSAWFHCLQVSDHIFSISQAVNTQMATSLPRSLILLLPPHYIPTLKPFIYFVSLSIGLLAFSSALRVMQVKLPEDIKLSSVFILGAFVTPLTVPHVFLYDYSNLYLAGLIAIHAPWKHERIWEYKRFVRVCWLVINVYTLTLFIHKEFAIPLVLMGCIILFFRNLLMIVEHTCREDAVQPVPMATY